MCFMCLLAKQHTVFKWKDAISGFPVLQGSAESLDRWGGKTLHRLISYFLSNTSAKNYRNQIVYVNIIASQRWHVFLRTSIHIQNISNRLEFLLYAALWLLCMWWTCSLLTHLTLINCNIAFSCKKCGFMINVLMNVAVVNYCIIIRPHRSTTYIDAAYCYRPSSVVCRSVGLSH